MVKPEFGTYLLDKTAYLLDKDLDSYSGGAENLRNPPFARMGCPGKGATARVPISLFHEPWWLSAATGGHFEEAIVKQGDDVVGRLPYVMQRRGPFYCVRMPPFTHMLGPAIEELLHQVKCQQNRIRQLFSKARTSGRA